MNGGKAETGRGLLGGKRKFALPWRIHDHCQASQQVCPADPTDRAACYPAGAGGGEKILPAQTQARDMG